MVFTKEQKIYRKEKQEELNNKIEELGFWNINQSELSKKWDIPKQTINDWCMKKIRQMTIIDYKTCGVEGLYALRTAIKQCQLKAAMASDYREEIEYYRVMIDLIRIQTDLLERYFIKPKIATKIEVEQKSVSFVIEMPEPIIEIEKKETD